MSGSDISLRVSLRQLLRFLISVFTVGGTLYSGVPSFLSRSVIAAAASASSYGPAASAASVAPASFPGGLGARRPIIPGSIHHRRAPDDVRPPMRPRHVASRHIARLLFISTSCRRDGSGAGVLTNALRDATAVTDDGRRQTRSVCGTRADKRASCPPHSAPETGVKRSPALERPCLPESALSAPTNFTRER